MVCGFVGGETWVGDGEGKRAEGARSLARHRKAGAARKAQLSNTHTRGKKGVTGCNRSKCYLGRLSRGVVGFKQGPEDPVFR